MERLRLSICYFCRSEHVFVTYRQQRHKVDKTFGPFDLFECADCGSMGTANPPSPDRLGEFYRRYDEFRPDWYKAGSESGALQAQYEFYAKQVDSSGSWADIGAGHGEVANIIALKNDAGTAIDIGPRPAGLSRSIEYISADMNVMNWSAQIGRRFENVYSVAVWEHVLSPKDFARECLSLVAPGGTLTLICPDYGSLARKALNRHWPYFEPGEHISIPSRRGAMICLQAVSAELGIRADISARALSVGYSIRYVLEVIRMRAIAKMLPPNLSAPLPTGLLLARAAVHQA